MLGMNNLTTAGEFFLIISGELIPIFIAVSFLVGVITENLPPERIRDYIDSKFKWLGYVFGAGFGALTPFCSCSTVPITAGLLRGGVPFGPTMSFLFSSPILNPVIVVLFLTLLGYKIAIFYVCVTFLSSILAAWLLSRLGMGNQVKDFSPPGTACCAAQTGTIGSFLPSQEIFPAGECCDPKNPKAGTTFPREPDPVFPVISCCAGSSEITKENISRLDETLRVKMKRAFVFAMRTFKQVFWYLLLGAGIGAFIYGFFPQDLVVTVAGPGNPWSIPVAAVIGVPMYIRAETIIPISAALVGKGMGMGTVLALIIGGAGASIPEIILLGSIFKKKLLAAFALNVFLVAMIAGYLVDFFLY